MKTLNTIQKLSKIGQILSKTICIFCIIGFCGCIIGIFSIAIGAPTLKIGGITLESILSIEAGVTTGTVYAVMLAGMILCAGEAVLTKFAEHYFKRELVDGTPFDLGGAKELMRLGILAIGIPIGTQMIAEIVYAVMKQTLHSVAPFQLEHTSSVALGVMFIVMSLGCRYGAELREMEEKEMDNKASITARMSSFGRAFHAKILGNYIAARRKELGMTQANLAEKIQVTDKAVSRWERGIGLPDIDNLEALAKALDVSLVSLMQGKACEEKHISIREAEELVTDTIKMSKETSKIQKGFWGSILGVFGIIIMLLCVMLLRDGKIIFYSVASIITGLIAWGIPIIDRVFLKTYHAERTMLVSVGVAFLSVWIQFLDIKNLAYTSNWSAIHDTINVLLVVVIMFCIITLLLNFINIRKKYA